MSRLSRTDPFSQVPHPTGPKLLQAGRLYFMDGTPFHGDSNDATALAAGTTGFIIDSDGGSAAPPATEPEPKKALPYFQMKYPALREICVEAGFTPKNRHDALAWLAKNKPQAAEAA